MKELLSQIELILGYRNVEDLAWVKGRVFFYVNALKGMTVIDISQGVYPVYKGEFPSSLSCAKEILDF